MGYDVEFVRVHVPQGTSFPITKRQAERLLSDAKPFDDPEAVIQTLADQDGCKPNSEGGIEFMGRGLSYATFEVKPAAIHVINNCSAKELLKIYNVLREQYADLCILDLQSGDLHSGDSFLEWWAKPL